MTCLVFGASGQIGQYLLPRLSQAGRQVVGVSRVPHAPADGMTWLCGRLPDAVPPLSADISAIVCLGPLDHFSHWIQQADIVDAPRVIAMSSMSAETKRDSPDPDERELASRLRESERRLLARCEDLGSACTILRATLIYGGAGGSLEKLAVRALRWRVFPLPRGCGLRQPVHADDLAQAVWAALERPQATGVIPIGGGERLPVAIMFARARRHLAPATVPLPLSGMGLRLVAQCIGRARGMTARLDRDLVADNEKLLRFLAIQPRAFAPRVGNRGR